MRHQRALQTPVLSIRGFILEEVYLVIGRVPSRSVCSRNPCFPPPNQNQSKSTDITPETPTHSLNNRGSGWHNPWMKVFRRPNRWRTPLPLEFPLELECALPLAHHMDVEHRPLRRAKSSYAIHVNVSCQSAILDGLLHPFTALLG